MTQLNLYFSERKTTEQNKIDINFYNQYKHNNDSSKT